jgi:prefoldin subunit 5
MKALIDEMIPKIKAQMGKIAENRDSLDEMISELESLKEDCNEAYEHLMDARDALSRLV